MVKGYLLDTNMVGYYYSGHAHVLARVNSLPDQDLLMVSAITLGEICFGHELTESTNHEKRQECDRFVNQEFPLGRVLPVRRHTRMYYGDLKARLFKQYPPQSQKENHPECCFDRVTGKELGIDENDLWIAAQAIEHDLIIVTNDQIAKLRSVAPELDVEDWTQPL